MKKIFLLFVLILLFFNACYNIPENNIYTKKYLNDIKHYPDSLIWHFPKRINQENSFYKIIYPDGVFANNYFGIQFIEKADSSVDVKELINTLAKKNSFKSSFIEHQNNSATHLLFPYPNIENFLLEEEFKIFNIKIKNIEYTYYLISLGDKILYPQQLNNKIGNVKSGINHGYSSGIAINKENNIFFYWLIFW